MSKAVKVYTTSTCPYCTMVKNFLKEKNITFEEADVGRDRTAAKEMVDKSGQMGVPVVDIEGKIIVGFDKEAISRELGG
ncbi:MAG: glutathione S-transferase N-terminal domain-containing protein [Deltaproteobacteria bacterium]|nr:MAG: glutathione S-transferase N-terminal domain-containing protein [Deltaproteobacteria bacterium]